MDKSVVEIMASNAEEAEAIARQYQPVFKIAEKGDREIVLQRKGLNWALIIFHFLMTSLPSSAPETTEELASLERHVKKIRITYQQ